MRTLYRESYGQFVKGAFILTIATFIVKILSAIYRIPYQNIAGDVAFYIYQQVYPLYGILLVFSTYGFPVIISKLVAERIEQERKEEIGNVLLVSFLTLSILCISLFYMLIKHTSELAVFLGDTELEPLIYVVSFFCLAIPFNSVLRGYFQGYNEMVPTAISQVSDQIVRVSIIILATVILVPMKVDLYFIGMVALLGGVIGSLVGSISLLIFFIRKKKKVQWHWQRLWKFSSFSIVKAVIFQGLTICVANLVFILMQFIDSITLYTLLVENGAGTHMAKVIKGVYDRGLPLIQVGTIVATALSLSLVPVISMAYAKKDIHTIKEKVTLSLKVNLFVGIAASVGLMCVMKPTNIMLFENARGTTALAILAYAILFGSMAMATATILQGIGGAWIPAFHVLIGMIVKYIGNSILVPLFAENGAAIATIVALFFIALLNYFAIVHYTKMRLFKTIGARKALVTSVIMGAILILLLGVEQFLFGSIEESRTLATGIVFVNVLVGALIYFALLVKYRIFSYEEVCLLTSNTFIRSMFKK
ncbi:MAG: oligosaccharide flippase family protein [Bacillaceae bacterium]